MFDVSSKGILRKYFAKIILLVLTMWQTEGLLWISSFSSEARDGFSSYAVETY